MKGGGYEKYWSVLCISTLKRQRKCSLIKIVVRQNRRRGDEGGRNSIENGGANKTEGLTK
jgi:hypothetical protein